MKLQAIQVAVSADEMIDSNGQIIRDFINNITDVLRPFVDADIITLTTNINPNLLERDEIILIVEFEKKAEEPTDGTDASPEEGT